MRKERALRDTRKQLQAADAQIEALERLRRELERGLDGQEAWEEEDEEGKERGAAHDQAAGRRRRGLNERVLADDRGQAIAVKVSSSGTSAELVRADDAAGALLSLASEEASRAGYDVSGRFASFPPAGAAAGKAGRTTTTATASRASRATRAGSDTTEEEGNGDASPTRSPESGSSGQGSVRGDGLKDSEGSEEAGEREAKAGEDGASSIHAAADISDLDEQGAVRVSAVSAPSTGIVVPSSVAPPPGPAPTGSQDATLRAPPRASERVGGRQADTLLDAEAEKE